jgi:hypothetical protein
MTSIEIELIFKAFYNRMFDPLPKDLDCCASLVKRGYLTPIKDGHRLAYGVAPIGYEFVQQYFWRN